MEERNMRKPNPVLMGMRNIAKSILSEYIFLFKEPDLEFKKLSAKDFITELSKYKGGARKILFKKHSRVINKIGNKWQEISRTHNFLSDGDKILKYLLDDGWTEEIARSNLSWLISKTSAIVGLYHFKQNLELMVEELRKDHNLEDLVISGILEEIKYDDSYMVSFSMNKGIRIYL